MTEYILMNKNRPVLAFLYESENHRATKITELFDLRYAPPGALDYQNTVNKTSFNDWWRGRAIPASRNQINRMLDYLKYDSTIALAEESFGLSLSDRYWINNPLEPQKWEDINFFDNDFSDDLGLMTLGQSSPQRPDLMSPNSTLGGNLRKKWTIINGERVLLKSGSELFRQEVQNEVVATHLYQRLLKDGEYVPYHFVKQGNRTYCACFNMLKEDEELIPAFDIIQNKKKSNSQNDYQFLVSCYKDLGLKNVEETLCKMFTCDYILANKDRHWRNFGVIRNVETLEYTRIAPIFDSGACLWFDAESLAGLTDFAYEAKPFGRNGMKPLDQLKLFHEYGWFDPSKLHGFADEAIQILSLNENIPAKRLDFIRNRMEKNMESAISHVRSCQKEIIQSISLEQEAKDCIAASHDSDLNDPGKKIPHDREK